MELFNFISWGFQALLLGGFGAIWFEIRKLRDRDIDMERRLHGLETKLAEKYITKAEFDSRFVTSVRDINRSLEMLTVKFDRKFEEYEKSRQEFYQQYGSGLVLIEKYAELLPILKAYLDKNA